MCGAEVVTAKQSQHLIPSIFAALPIFALSVTRSCAQATTVPDAGTDTLAVQGIEAIWLIVALALAAAAMGSIVAMLYLLATRLELRGSTRTAAIGVTLGLLAYGLFFVYRWSPVTGTLSSTMLLFASVLSLIIAHRRLISFANRNALADIASSIGLPLLFVGLYLSSLVLWSSNITSDLVQQRFFETFRPHDNNIPIQFAQAILQQAGSLVGKDAGGLFFSDRPPLQTGFILAFSPLHILVGSSFLYLAVGSLLQVSFASTSWWLVRVLGGGRHTAIIVMTALLVTPFMYYNSLYLWPKLLAASFTFLSLGLLLEPLVHKRRIHLANGVLAAAAASLALLAHGGALFCFMGIGLVMMFFVPKTYSIRNIAIMSMTVVALMSPWAAYTKFVDPNVSTLARLHLTAWRTVEYPSVLLQIVNSYRGMSGEQWASSRIANLKIQFGSRSLDSIIAGNIQASITGTVFAHTVGRKASYDPDLLNSGISSAAVALRIDQREHVFRSLGPLALGGLALVGMLLWRKRFNQIEVRAISILALVFSLTSLAWCVFMYKPGSAVITHASYAMIGGFGLIFTWALALWSHMAARALAILSAALLFVIWVASGPGPQFYADYPAQTISIQYASVALMVAFALAIVAVLLSLRRLEASSNDIFTE